MDKLVYLYELDSVRNSQKEIEKGQRAMYEEIVNKGNTVVLSFNQLSDSDAFLAAVKNEDTYESILELFKLGAIKISQFQSIRTASQYIQNSIDKCLEKEDNAFIFSGLPVKHTERRLLFKMKQALKNSDIDILDEYLEEEKLHLESEKESEKKSEDFQKLSERIKYSKRFLQMILDISVEGAVKNSPKSTFIKFSNVMEKIINCSNLKKFLGYEYLEQTIFILEVLQGQGLNSVDDRSKWLINLRSSKTENKVSIDGKTPVIEAWKLAEAVIDVCYNLTVEDSIYNVSKHNMGFEFSESFDSKTGKKNYIISEDFLFDLKNRLEEYFDLENGGIHTFLDDETTEGNVYTGFLPDWASAVRIVKRKKGQTEKSKANDIPLYENEDKKSTNSWRRKNIKYLGIAVLKFAVNVLFFSVATYVLNLSEEKLPLFDFLNSIDKGLRLPEGTFRSIIVFGIISSLVSKLIKLPDILESIITVTNNFVDTVKVFIYSKKKANSYSNRRYDEKCNMTIPASTILKSSSPLLYDAEWKEYEKFIKDRGKDSKIEEASEPLPIVEERERIKEYEFQTGQKIGVVYKSKFHTMVVDAIEGKDENGNAYLYPYERLLPTVDKGAVVILTKCNDKFVLLKQFRHSLREFQYACPRGFGEEEIIVDEKTKKEIKRELSPEENALKEISEEIGLDFQEGDRLKHLGTTVADSGICGTKVEVFLYETRQIPQKKVGYEGIDDLVLKTEEDLESMICIGELNDGYTMTAYCMYKSRQKKVK